MTFNKGDLIKSIYEGEGYFVGKYKGNYIMERTDKKGWTRKDNSGLVPDDYVPILKESFWAITPSQFELVEAAKANYEIY